MYKFICSAKYVKYAKLLAAKYTTQHIAAAAIIFGNSFHTELLHPRLINYIVSSW